MATRDKSDVHSLWNYLFNKKNKKTETSHDLNLLIPCSKEALTPATEPQIINTKGEPCVMPSIRPELKQTSLMEVKTIACRKTNRRIDEPVDSYVSMKKAEKQRQERDKTLKTTTIET